MRRGKRMGYKEGKFSFPPFLYGYDRGDGINPVIIPEQAAKRHQQEKHTDAVVKQHRQHQREHRRRI